MPIETKPSQSGAAVIAISGRLVLGKDLELLEGAVRAMLQDGRKHFVFDVTALDYADSAAMGSLVACLTSIRKAGGDLRMAGVNPRIETLLKLTGIDWLLPVYATVADAAAAG